MFTLIMIMIIGHERSTGRGAPSGSARRGRSTAATPTEPSTSRKESRAD